MESKKSFTLLELLVVIVIIGVLAAGISILLSRAREKGRDVKRIAELQEIVKALDIYNTSHGGKYPNSLSELIAERLLIAEPKDPLNNKDYFYRYCVNAEQRDYHLGAKLENKDHPALKNDADLVNDGCLKNSFSGSDREAIYDLSSSVSATKKEKKIEF